jgi:hypothetical protein
MAPSQTPLFFRWLALKNALFAPLDCIVTRALLKVFAMLDTSAILALSNTEMIARFARKDSTVTLELLCPLGVHTLFTGVALEQLT